MNKKNPNGDRIPITKVPNNETMKTKNDVVEALENNVIYNALTRMQQKYSIKLNKRTDSIRHNNSISDYYKQIEIIKNTKIEIMKTSITECRFTAQITDFIHGSKFDYYKYVNIDTTEVGQIPEWCILDFVILPDELMDISGEHIRMGARINLLKLKNGKTIPVNYPKKEQKLQNDSDSIKQPRMNPATLFEGAMPYITSSNTQELWKLFADQALKGNIGRDQFELALNSKTASEEEQAVILEKILGLESITISPQENVATEYKSSFVHSANPRKERNDQYKEIFKEIVAMANSHIAGNIYVGISNDTEIVGIQEELLNDVPFYSREDFVSDFKNRLKQSVCNYEFTSSVSFKWYKTEDNKLFCRIVVPEWRGGVLLLNGSELYVRDCASKHQLKDADMINYIIKHCSIAA